MRKCFWHPELFGFQISKDGCGAALGSISLRTWFDHLPFLTEHLELLGPVLGARGRHPWPAAASGPGSPSGRPDLGGRGQGRPEDESPLQGLGAVVTNSIFCSGLGWGRVTTTKQNGQGLGLRQGHGELGGQNGNRNRLPDWCS